MQLDDAFELQLTELVAWYNTVACPCAFPRFRALTGLRFDAMILEKESLISLARSGYEITDFSERNDKTEVWLCKTCISSFYANFTPLQVLPGRWHDLVVVSQHFLSCKDAGADPEGKIPLCLDTIPNHDVSEVARKMTTTDFIAYMRQLK